MADEALEIADLERDLPNFLDSLLSNTQEISQLPFDRENAEMHAFTLERAIAFLRTLFDLFDLEEKDANELDLLSCSLTNVLKAWRNRNGSLIHFKLFKITQI